jgi:hypothetical protein
MKKGTKVIVAGLDPERGKEGTFEGVSRPWWKGGGLYGIRLPDAAGAGVPGDLRARLPEFRVLWRNARIRSLVADCPAEQRDELIDTVAVVLGVPVETVREIAGG